MKKNLNVRFTAAALALLMSGAPIGLQAKAATSVDSATTTEANFDAQPIERQELERKEISWTEGYGININGMDSKLFASDGTITTPRAYNNRISVPLKTIAAFYGLEAEYDFNLNAIIIKIGSTATKIEQVTNNEIKAESKTGTVLVGAEIYYSTEIRDDENNESVYSYEGNYYYKLKTDNEIGQAMIYEDNNTTNVPIRAISELIGKNVEYKEGKVVISDPNKTPVEETPQPIEEYDGIKKPYYPNDPELQAKIDELYTYLPLYKPYDARVKELLNKLNKIEIDYGVQVEDLEANPNIPEEAKEYLKLADKGLAGIGNRWGALNFNYNNYECIKGAFAILDQEMNLLATYDDPKRIEDSYRLAKKSFIGQANGIIKLYYGTEYDLGIKEYLDETDAFIITQSQLIEGYIWQAKNIINGNKSVSNQDKNIKTFIKRI